MKLRTVVVYCLLCGLCLLAQACRYNWPGRTDGPVDIAASAPLQLTPDEPLGKHLYVTPVDGAPTVRAHVERGAQARGYTVVGQPSQADFVIYIHVAGAGEADADVTRQSVQMGYGEYADMTGDGAAVIIADVVVAARSVPQAGRQHGEVVAATSSRHIVAEQEARLAALMPHTRFERGRPALEQGLAEAVVAALPSPR